ncbi:MAG TPA: 50S ribosomal protein L25/general stress protein Ctc [Pseudolabrys sp.]|nr:50S ribosomal protein L25/general stress protein Ctc [Pseudolabrys sp.]
MASVQEMKATVRPKGGKGAARSARRSGRVPGVIYGNNEPPVMVLIEHDELRKRIYGGRFLTTLYQLDVDGTKHRVIPRDFQLDAIKDLPMHVDFLRVAEGAAIRVHIPVHVLNTDQSPGVKRGGAVNVVTHNVEIVCPADAIPDAINVDIAGLEISHSKHLNDVALPPGVRVIGRPDMTLVTIVPPSGYAEEQKAAAEAAAAAAAAPPAAGAAGAAPPAAGAAGAGGAGAAPAAEKK